jgi:capsule polysaccharide export protein KpsE/RkpR
VIHEFEPTTELEFPGPSPPSEIASEQRSTMRDNLQLLWEKRRSLYRVAAWALSISIIVVLLIPNQYESSVRIMPPDPTSNAGSMLAALTGKGNPELMAMAGNLLGIKGSGALYVDLFRSRSVQDNIVDRLQLQSVYWAHYRQDARKKLDSRTVVSEDRKSGVITLAVADRSPERARQIAQAYVEELNRLLAQVSTSSARRERIFIEQRLISVKSDLEDSEKRFSAFASKNTALDIKEQTKAMVESAAVLQGQLVAAQSELQSLEQIYTDNNVRVRALRARIAELQHQMESMRGSDSSLLSDTGGSDELYPSVRKLPLLGVEWADLYRRTKIEETVYELLNQQYELARIQEAKEIPTVNVVDSPNLPEKKSWPPRVLLTVILTLFSAAGAALFIISSHKIEALDQDDPRRQIAATLRETLTRLRDRITSKPLFRRRNGTRPPDPGSA